MALMGRFGGEWYGTLKGNVHRPRRMFEPMGDRLFASYSQNMFIHAAGSGAGGRCGSGYAD